MEHHGLIELERRFWMEDVNFYRKNLASGCLMVFPEMNPMGRSEVIAAISAAPRWSALEMEDVRTEVLSDSAVALAYRARAHRVGEGPEKEYRAVIGSVYLRIDDRWLLAFHQHAPLS